MEKNFAFALSYLRRRINQSLNLELHTTKHSKTQGRCPQRIQNNLRTSNSTVSY